MKFVKYLVVGFFHDKDKSEVITEYNSLSNARLYIEATLRSMQVEIQGESPYMQSSDMNAINTVKSGMFVLTENGDRWRVFKKIRTPARFWGSYSSVVRLIDFSIVEIECEQDISMSIRYENQANFTDVLNELLSKVKATDPDS